MMKKDVCASLDGGILADCFRKTRRNFYEVIDAEVHKQVYYGEHHLMYAEPEFTGKYLDICAHYYEMEKDERALKKAFTVIDGIEANIREDGHITAYPRGNEVATFGIWNHFFTLYGLSRVAEVSGDKRAMELSVRAADFIANLFLQDNPPELFSELNNGSEHIACLYSMARMYKMTGKKLYLDFIEHVISYCEKTDMNLITFEDILALRSRKGIEMLVVYLGILTYGMITKNDAAIAAARRYWCGIRDTQIRNTGNGTIVEFWTENGNAHRFLPTEEKPNETCVAVGWSELSLMLLFHSPRAEYADELEQTVYNHMIGSFDKSGEDFAYYQGNYGKKIFRKPNGIYQCCRYRGYTLFSYLPSFMFYDDGETVIPVLYAEASYEKDGLSVKEITDYPRNGAVRFDIKNSRGACRLFLRTPKWCESYTVTLNGEAVNAEREEGGFLVLNIPMGDHTVSLDMVMDIKVESVLIDEKKYLTYHYGPLLLTLDTHFGGSLETELSLTDTLTRVEDDESLVHFVSGDAHIVDFGSAGRNDPENDVYTVYIKEK